MSAPSCQQDIVKVLPQVSVFFKIDDYGSLLAAVINQELDSAHTCTVRIDADDVKRSVESRSNQIDKSCSPHAVHAAGKSCDLEHDSLTALLPQWRR
jgi:hypothetical protein